MNTPALHSYDPANARALCLASAAAYLSDQSDRSDRTTLISSAATDTHALIARSDSDLVVAFRGTADLRNWLTDLDCQKTPLRWSAGKVHRGFNLALEFVAERLDRALDPTDPHRIWVTGHSLGGALAMLFALRLQVRRKIDVAGVYTFGQPRVGNAAFSLAYDAMLKARTFRLVHADDIVPRVPWLMGSYRHAGHEVFFPFLPITNNKFSITNSQFPKNEAIENWPLKIGYWQLDPSWWQKLPSGLAALCREWKTGRCALLSDHCLKSYVDVLAPPSVPITNDKFSMTNSQFPSERKPVAFP